MLLFRNECVTEDEGAKQRGRSRKTCEEVADKHLNDLHLKSSDAVDHGEGGLDWTGGNLGDSNNDNDGVS